MPFSRRTSRINAEAARGQRRLDPQEVFQREGLESRRIYLAKHEVCLMRPVRHRVPVRTQKGYRRINYSHARRPDEPIRAAEPREGSAGLTHKTSVTGKRHDVRKIKPRTRKDPKRSERTRKYSKEPERTRKVPKEPERT